jgi:hypothetical protein
MAMNKRNALDLKSLIEFASAQAEKIFRKTGVLYPMYHVIRTNGENLIMLPPPGDKDQSVALMKAWLVLEGDIEMILFMDEAWRLDISQGGPEPDEKVMREGLRHHPDRREVVWFAAENRQGEILTGARFILRPEHGKATLSPLRIDTEISNSSGRMVGLLNPEKR